MSKLVRLLDGKSVVALAIAGCAAALLAGCSSDVSGLSNPFADSARFGGSTDQMATGSLAPPAPIGGEAAPVRPVESAPVGFVASAPLAPVGAPSSTNWAASAAPVRPTPVETASAPVHSDHAVYQAAHGQWLADGGTYVTVRPGENAATLAQRYDVPLEALIHVNGFVSAAQMRPGARIVIPVYTASNGRPVARASFAPSRPPMREASAERDSAQGRTVYHFVQGPQSAYDRAHADAATRRKDHDRASAKNDRETKTRTAELRDDFHAKTAKSRSRDVASAEDRQSSRSEEAAPAKMKAALSPARKSVIDAAATGSLPPEEFVASAARPDFGWPARGRIIAGFRAGVNDGINIAVPDGTNVRAVDDGVVAYAGDELRGYGNLVLIRHPNGFVSAYADNGSIEVHRGETVRRGQVIAKSGQSGNVSSPQLHFELRKGQTPVDPTQYLAGL